MRHVYVVLAVITCSVGLAQDNPFMRMAGEKYADYSQELSDKYYRVDKDTVEIQKMIAQIKEVVEKTGSKTWELELKTTELMLFDAPQISGMGADEYENDRIRFNNGTGNRKYHRTRRI